MRYENYFSLHLNRPTVTNGETQNPMGDGMIFEFEIERT